MEFFTRYKIAYGHQFGVRHAEKAIENQNPDEILNEESCNHVNLVSEELEPDCQSIVCQCECCEFDKIVPILF